MRSKFSALALLAVLSFTGAAYAQRQIQKFSDQANSSEDQFAAARDATRSNLPRFAETMEQKPRPFPWKFAIFIGVVLLAAAPFAAKAYRGTVDEVIRPGQRRRARREEIDEEA